MRLSLHRAMLSYGGGLLLHTASSGPVAGLDTLYLALQDADGIAATGEVRINIAYLNGLAAEYVVTEALALLPGLDLTPAPETLLAAPPPLLSRASAPLRMLVDLALHDLAAKRAGQPLAAFLAKSEAGPVTYATNQTLFISDDATFQRQAQAYVGRGFRDLKVRIGAADFTEDLARIGSLRTRFGAGVKIAVDANAAWSLADAPARLEALAPFDLAYVEQPVAPMGFDVLARLAEASPVPIMLDESVRGEDDAMRLATGGHRLMVHLKLVKLGGLAPALRAARALAGAGVPCMIGQMNEGGLATAAALHLCAATQPRFAELYGADGLSNDPAPGLVYADGLVSAPARPGLGLSFARERTETLWEN
ncbi:mandelate racemase/muconate lactonizing enzyme family protein [Bosea psychrotolerans]|uniref:L-alanine-DL-glutamate epimerase-like enolase superfamily enzyme n=1 Tax=Bosea psychrotolerans TaxID=1871628 RepID=A0A2S4MCL3_9HYPH|nr:mandelate racemase/muconate lactonizing enzyme family protein [Bosea psychrotolerans]POR52498.1 L-alanine-DL-glutamate epimerase-like enolase superfamily enzyme [Bosea psychrotolerans]